MKLVEIVALALRIGGIFLFVDLIKQGPLLLSWLDHPAEQNRVVIFSTLIYLSQIAVLVFLPVTIAKLVVPRSLEESPTVDLKGESLECAAFMVLGIYILSSSIPDIVDIGLSYAVLDTTPSEYYPTQQVYELKRSALYTAIEILIASYLIFGAPKLVSLLRRLRSFGTQ